MKNNKKSRVKIQQEERYIEEEVYRDMQKIIDRNIAMIYHLISTPVPILLLNSEFSKYAKSDKAIIEKSDVEKRYREMYETKGSEKLYQEDIGMFRYVLMVYCNFIPDSIFPANFWWQTNIVIEINKILLSVLHHIEEFSKDLEDISDVMVNEFFDCEVRFLVMRYFDMGGFYLDAQEELNNLYGPDNSIYYYFDGIDELLW